MNKTVKKRLIWFIIIFLSIILIDQVSKYLVDKNMYIYQSKNIIKDWVRFTYIQNEGFLMGLASHLNDGRTFNPIVLITIAALLVVIGYFVYLILYTKTNDFLVITFSILLGGAFGNFIDRIVRKTVVDFIEFKFFHFQIGKFRISSFPIFNFADFFVTTGIVLLIIYFLFLEKKYSGKERVISSLEEKIQLNNIDENEVNLGVNSENYNDNQSEQRLNNNNNNNKNNNNTNNNNNNNNENIEEILNNENSDIFGNN